MPVIKLILMDPVFTGCKASAMKVEAFNVHAVFANCSIIYTLQLN